MSARRPAMLLAAVNTGALIAYLFWMARHGQERLFHAQEGVLYLLPVLPIFVVYIMIARGRSG